MPLPWPLLLAKGIPLPLPPPLPLLGLHGDLDLGAAGVSSFGFGGLPRLFGAGEGNGNKILANGVCSACDCADILPPDAALPAEVLDLNVDGVKMGIGTGLGGECAGGGNGGG